MENLTYIIDGENQNIILEKSSKISLTIKEQATVYIEINGGSEFELHVDLIDNANAELVYWNQNKENMTITESYQLASNSFLKLTYGELADIDVERTMKTDLKEGSELLVDSASITSGNKTQQFLANHLEGHTESNVNNYSIVVEGGSYALDVIGKIDKGAKAAKAFQESRILTTSGKQKATVLPQLLIYENDVEASHAATVGQINMDHLYYMQTRGMSEMQAMALVMSSYLMPIARAIKDEKIAEQVISLIDKRVNEICFVVKQ